jgi:hypothetical protein
MVVWVRRVPGRDANDPIQTDNTPLSAFLLDVLSLRHN